MNKNIKPIAFYLPQFHPIPENDEWWGKGFTEWTNVTKAKPLFEGHFQPRLPADLGFYDLRISEARIAQAELAKQFGIYGFCYWHYWFAGKQILERPFREVVMSGEPNFPFCLAWANQTWEGTWHGVSNDKILIEQTYPGIKDYEAHFYELLNAFKDTRYIEVGGKKLFFIFKGLDLPDSKIFIDCWQALAQKEGLNGMHFVAMHMSEKNNFQDYGYDAIVEDSRPWGELKEISVKENTSFDPLLFFKKKDKKRKVPRLFSYDDFVELNQKKEIAEKEYPLLYCDWDNTPRSGSDGWLFNGFSLEIFEKECARVFELASNKIDHNNHIVIVKSWNEWAEGNYLEPDQRYGLGLLKAFKSALERFTHL